MSTWKSWRQLAALSLIAVLLAGCLSVRTTGTHKIAGEVGGIEVAVFADDAARRAGQVGPRFVVGELERKEGKGWAPIFRSLDPRWSVVNLPPGKYRVRFTGVLDESGNAEQLDDPGRVLRIERGKVSEVQVTIDHFPTALVVAGVVTAVVAAVVLADWLGDHDLPDIIPPPPVVADAVFHLTLDLATLPGECCPGGVDLDPVMTSHFPEEGALVAGSRVRVIFAASEPLNPRDVEAGGVTVLAETAGLVAGTMSYDPEHWWVVWTPNQDLPRDDVLHVTLAADAIEDLSGNELDGPVSFTFRTTP